jgi:hypothetical protein
VITAYGEAAGRAARGLDDNPFASVCDGRLQLKQSDALEIPERTRQLRHAIETGLPRVRIEQLLQEVDRHCGFTRELRPIGGYEPRLSNLYHSQLAALIAHGTNLGIAAMGHSAEGITADMLQHVSRFFLTETTLKAANAALVNFHHRLGFSKLWGPGTTSSSDGQRFGIQASSLLASFYPRYFGYYERAVTLYTHTSDQYSVFSTRAISCTAREALYVLDGLLENDTILRPREHYTDTHGFTEQLFGLCYLLGYSFMPRLRDLTDQQLYRVDPEIPPENLRPLLRTGLDLSLLAEQWDQLVRVAASLRNRVASASRCAPAARQRLPRGSGSQGPHHLGPSCQDHLHPALHSRRRAQAAGPAPAQSRRVAPWLGALVVLRKPRRVSHRRLRGDHEQGQLPQPAVQCGAGVEHAGHHENRHSTARHRRAHCR